VSLLSANRVVALLGIDSISVVRCSAGFTKKVVDKKYVQFTQPEEALKIEAQIWKIAVTQLSELLSDMQLPYQTKLSITLTSDFVRYLALPTQQLYMNAQEKLAYATAAYREIYGVAVDAWQIKLNDAPSHQATIAVAVDNDLLSELKLVAAENKMQLVSVQPYLTNAFNCLSSQIGRSGGYLAIVESRRLLLVNLHQGYCDNVRTFASGVDWQLELKRVLNRELLLGTEQNKEISIFAPMQNSVSINSIEGWKITRIGNSKDMLAGKEFAMLEVAL
jgi:hypothetical protein